MASVMLGMVPFAGASERLQVMAGDEPVARTEQSAAPGRGSGAFVGAVRVGGATDRI